MRNDELVGDTDYSIYYNLESYLFETVRKSFSDNGYLLANDFFCIVIWKAERAKSKIAAKLLHNGHGDLGAAVHALTTGIAKRHSLKEKLRYVWEDWEIPLPTASAILTVLYPDDFTIYDARVCTELKRFDNLRWLTTFERLWPGYQEFVQVVRQQAPDKPKLRDKDRYLWGRSFFLQLESDIEKRFGV